MKTSVVFTAVLCLLAAPFIYAQDMKAFGPPEKVSDGTSLISISKISEEGVEALKAEFELLNPGHAWVLLKFKPILKYNAKIPVVFEIKSGADCLMEIKFVDKNGATFLKKVTLNEKYKEWTRLAVYFKDLEYGWGGDGKFKKLEHFELAFSKDASAKGSVLLRNVTFGKKGEKASFSKGSGIPDPNANLAGYGFDQRRDKSLAPENPLVLEWIKMIQDHGSPDKKLVPTLDVEDWEAQTFNNMLVAMAFILKGERERAERILDFYSKATNPDNEDKGLQNFFYRGEARGFYQRVAIRNEKVTAYHDQDNSDRWMGDLCWMIFAYKYHEKEYRSEKYVEMIKLLKGLLLSWYKPAQAGGYIESGWRKGDSSLHEAQGHPEGNIDAYAAMLLCGEKKTAENIKKWIDNELDGKTSLPLDLYTWRVMAFGKPYGKLMAYPDTDLRYLKTLDFLGRRVKGVWHSAAEEIQNIWVDGMGHMACGFYAIGEPKRGFFYANQMDNTLIDREIKGVKLKALPYALTKQGGFEWYNFDKGSVSCAAWYIFAKNQFNPMRLTRYNYK